MVQLFKRGEMQRGELGQVKLKIKVEDNLEGEEGHLNKRSKHSPSFEDGGIGLGGHPAAAAAAQYNPLAEPSPLGLRLRKSPSLLELIQMKLYQGKSPKGVNQVKKENKGGASTSGSTEKLKASNFPATVLRIGSWEYISRYEGDLVAKCYFAKHKLVWEVLDGGLKNKIEIQWSDISALRAKYPDDGLGTLDVVLARPPVFFRETNPQPRKHTLWQATSDFTNGQASLQRHHFLQCPQGLLGKHFEKLIQCDPRLNFLSQQVVINLDSPFFEHRLPLFDDPTDNKARFDMNGGSSGLFHLSDAPSPSGGQCSSSRNETDSIGWTRESVRNETPSPSSVMDTRANDEMKSYMGEPWKELSNWDQIKVPGLHTSMSMSDLVSHLENRVSEQQKSSSPNNVVLSTEERQGLEILDEISRCLLSDSQFVGASDEKSLMSRVNSLCCLLQKDPQPPLSSSSSSKNHHKMMVVPESIVVPSSGIITNTRSSKAVELHPEEEEDREQEEEEEVCFELRQKQSSTMSRKDSVGELLLNLPRIASLPHFLFNTGEEGQNQAH